MTSPSTYAALLRSLAQTGAVPCQDFVTPQGVTSRDSHAVLDLAIRRGRQLKGLGLVTGDRVGIVVTDPAEFLPLVHGCLLFGLVAMPMYPPPPFSHLATYCETLAAILRVAQAKLVVADAGLPARLGEISAERVIEVSRLTALAAEPQADDLPPVEPTDLALLQFTSGSTAEPRGVQISHRALMANVHAIMVGGLAATAADRGVSWLPLYHDMGLIGFGLAPLLTQTPVTFIPTARFVRNPSIWLQTLSETRATITFAPNFAYALTTRRAPPTDLDLRCVRMWGCGAEPVSEHTLVAFEQHLANSGVEPRSVSPCYGLAEATLAVAFTPPGGPRICYAMDSDKWEAEGVAVAREADDAGGVTAVVACGAPLPGYSVRVVDTAGAELSEGQVGEIVVSGPSLGEGYAGDAAATARAFTEHGLKTGDRGFIRAGRLFVAGRIKDTLIVNGRKYDPHVIEQCAEQVNGVRRAAAVNLSGADGEALVVLVECAIEARDELAEGVRARIAAHIGVAVARVVCLPAGALPRTTSGKIRRSAAKTLA